MQIAAQAMQVQFHIWVLWPYHLNCRNPRCLYFVFHIWEKRGRNRSSTSRDCLIYMEIEVWYFWESFQLCKRPIIGSKWPDRASSISWEAFLSRGSWSSRTSHLSLCVTYSWLGTLPKASFPVWSDIRLSCVKALSFVCSSHFPPLSFFCQYC